MSPAERLLDEVGIGIVAPNVAPRPGQTRAPETLNRIIRRHGEAHARLVLTLVGETVNNGLILDETGFWMASDMIRVCPDIRDKHFGDLLELFDAMPMGDLHKAARMVSGIVPTRFALDGMVFERMLIRFGNGQLEMFDDRRQA